jgi:hypothetical protein
MFTKVGIFKHYFTQNVLRKVKYEVKITNSAFSQKVSGEFQLFLSTFVKNDNITM